MKTAKVISMDEYRMNRSAGESESGFLVVNGCQGLGVAYADMLREMMAHNYKIWADTMENSASSDDMTEPDGGSNKS